MQTGRREPLCIVIILPSGLFDVGVEYISRWVINEILHRKRTAVNVSLPRPAATLHIFTLKHWCSVGVSPPYYDNGTCIYSVVYKQGLLLAYSLFKSTHTCLSWVFKLCCEKTVNTRRVSDWFELIPSVFALQPALWPQTQCQKVSQVDCTNKTMNILKMIRNQNPHHVISERSGCVRGKWEGTETNHYFNRQQACEAISDCVCVRKGL